MLQLSDYLTTGRVLADMRSANKLAAIEELAALVTRDAVALLPDVHRVFTERERLASTGIGEGIAIPHGKLDAVGDLVLALARSRDGLDFQSEDGEPAQLFFVLVAPESSTGIHLKALARISRLCKEQSFRARLLAVADASEMFEVLCEEDRRFCTPT